MMAGPMRRIPRPLRPLLLFLPSLVLGLLGGVWLLFRPLRLEAQAGPLTVLLAAGALLLALLGTGWLLERTLPSFRHAGKLLERALQGLTITLPLALGLALATALAEELFFRGALLGLIGVWGQALLFGLLHPATRRGWSYTLFTFVAGLAFGYATLWTGSLWAAMLAHFVINLQGFLEIRTRQRRTRSRMATYGAEVAQTAARATVPTSPGSTTGRTTDPGPLQVPGSAGYGAIGATEDVPDQPPEPTAATSALTEHVPAASDEARPGDGASPGSAGSAAPPPREPPAP
jgi:membrane protease YdiL (CAAX protease family)